MNDPELRELYERSREAAKPISTDLRSRAIEKLSEFSKSHDFPEEDQKKIRDALSTFQEGFEHFFACYVLLRRQDIIKKLTSAKVELTPDQMDEIRNKIATLPNDDLVEASQLSALAHTSDALGIVLRGHVLIERHLDKCINARLVRPLDLHDDLRVFFDGKVKLATALGVLTAEENRLIVQLNQYRNEFAHPKKSSNSKAHKLTVAEERRLWASFVTIPTLATNAWPEFPDEPKLALRIIFVALTLLLSGREQEIIRGQVPSPTVQNGSETERAMRAVMSSVLIGPFRQLNEHLEG